MERWGCFYCDAKFALMQECEDHEIGEHWGEHVVVNFLRTTVPLKGVAGV